MDTLLKYLRYYHLTMMVIWPLLAIPTILWWKESVVWVAILSLYANFASEFAAWHGARTEKKQDEQNGDA
jgi:hypothetical protein